MRFMDSPVSGNDNLPYGHFLFSFENGYIADLEEKSEFGSGLASIEGA